MAVFEEFDVDVVVLGGGPGGYTAAFRAADLGKNVAIVEKFPVLGGVCLNVGCVPSKALLHVAALVSQSNRFVEAGIFKESMLVETGALRKWKDSIIEKLTSGLTSLAKRRKVQVVQGVGEFVGEQTLRVVSQGNESVIRFQHAIVATGSKPMWLPFLPRHPRIMNSTDALALNDIPKSLLVIGGGVIGLEMATVYQALGCEVTVVEIAENIIPGVEKGTVRPLYLEMKKKMTLHTGTRVTKVSATGEGLSVELEGGKAPQSMEVEKVLVAIGRKPNLPKGLDVLGVTVDERGFVETDGVGRTNVLNIYAIGDVTRGPMLAHKASAEGRKAAEAIAGGVEASETIRCIPQVAYTTPEVAVCGMSEMQASQANRTVAGVKFPFAANARAMTLDEAVGFAKLIFDEETNVILGAEIVGPHAGELISEMCLAVQNGLTVKQISDTIHPHPSLSESMLMAAEIFEGTVTDLYIPRK